MLKNKIVRTILTKNQIALFYLGQVGFIIKLNEKHILIDGYLSDYVDKNCCSESTKWVRRYPAPMAPADLDFVDYVFCTHTHYDHTDPDTIDGMLKTNQKALFFGCPEVAKAFRSYGVPEDRIKTLCAGKSFSLFDSVSVTSVPAAHEELHRDENGEYTETGFLFNFAGTRLFHGGDGCPYDGLEEQLKGTDILILPINGRDDYRRYVQDIIGCFNSTEAITLAKNIGADMLIPVHFDLYDVNCLNPAIFVNDLQKLNPAQKFHIFMPGEGYIYF